MKKAWGIALVVAAVALAPGAQAADEDRATLERYARDTWASFVAMTDPETGLPADSLRADGERSVQTSTTNIGAYMWSTVVAEKLGIIDHGETLARLGETIGTLERMSATPRAASSSTGTTTARARS